MADRIAGLSISMDMETAGLDRSITQIKRDFRGLSSSVKTNMNNMKYGEKSVDSYKDGINRLSEDIKKQEKNVEGLGNEYESLTDEQKRGAKGVGLVKEWNRQSDELNRMNHMLGNYTDELHNMEIENSTWFKTGDVLEGVSGKLQGAADMAGNLGTSLTNKITKPAAIAAGAIGGIVTAFGWGRLVSLDSAQAKLKGLGYTTEEVGSISDTVTDAIDGGMTTMAEGVDVAAGALAAGVDEGKDLEKYIQLVGDAAVGANRPVEDMAQIFNRVQGQGKLMTQELNMVEQSMPGFSNAMAEHMGVGVEEFREMVTAGEVSSEDFIEVMDDFAGGMADAYADSFSGMVQNTKAYIGQIGEQLLGGVFEQSKESLREFEDILSSEETMNAAADMGEKLGEAFTKLVEGVKGVVNWFRSLDGAQQKLILQLAGLLVALGPVLKVFGFFLGPLAKVTGWFGAMFKKIAPLLTPLTRIGTAAGGAAKSTGLLSRAFGLLGGPIGWAITIITTLAGIFTTAYKKSETFRNFIHKLGEKIKEVFFAIVDWIKPGFDAVLSFFGEIKTKISEFTNNEGPQLIEAFQNIWGVVGPILGWIGDKVKWVFEKIIKPIMTGVMWAVEEVIKMVWGNIKGVITGVLDVIMGSIKAFSGLIRGDWSAMWDGVLQLTTGAIKAAWNYINLLFIGRILKGVGTLAKMFGGAIKGMWTKTIGFFKNGITSAWNWIRESFVGRITGKIISFAKNFRSHISNLWNAVKTKFIETIKSIYNRVKESFVGRIIRNITGFAKHFRTKISSMWTYIKNKFVEVIRNIVLKIKDSFVGNIISKIAGFSKNFKSKISSMWTTIKSKFTTMISSIRKSIANSFVGKILKSGRSLKTKFTGIISDMWTATKKKFTEMVDGAKGLPKRIGDGIAGAKKGAIDGMKKMGNGLLKWAAKPFNAVGTGVNWVTQKLGMGKVIEDKWEPKKYAKGTGGHPGGAAVLGDGKGSNSGSELVSTPGGGSFLSASSPTLYPNLPKGTQVLPAKQTKQVPMYGKGIFGSTKDFVGKMWGGAKKAGSWIAEKVGDVWDYVKNPSKLVDKVLNGIGYPSKDSVGEYPFELIKNSFSKIKKETVGAVKGWFTEAEEGGAGKPNFDYDITSPFGPRPSLGGHHNGVDFGFPSGTHVKSQTDGNVSFAGYGKKGSGYGGYGNVISVKSGAMEVLYAHLSKIMKKANDSVSKGQIIGKSGNTGDSTGPHLHYEVRKNGTPVDPMKLSSGGKGSPGGAGVERWRSQVKQALKANNLSTSKAMQDKVLRQIKTESGGNEKIKQSSNVMDVNMRMGNPAQGLMQTIPSTFNAYKHSGHGNILNGYDNLLASLAYAKDEYGNNLGHLGSGIGYKQGTNYVPQDGPAMLHKGEAVIPREFNQPAKRTGATKLLALVGKQLQKEDKSEQRQTHTDAAQTAALQQQNTILQQQTNILMQLLQKDNNVYLDGDDITNNVNQKNALAAIGKHF